MPHLTVEYTSNLKNLDAKQCLLQLNSVLIDSGQFDEIDIKGRAVRLDEFLIGASPEQRGFVHVKLSLLSGRSAEIKRQLSGRLLERLRQICSSDSTLPLQLCVEVLDIDRDSYSKTVL